MQQQDSLLDIISVMWKWRKHILSVTILAIIGAVIISLLLPNYFTASTTFYAASEDLAKPNPVGELDRNRRYYGNDTDIDRLLSIAKSSDVRNYLTEEFKLYQHYAIDPSSKDAEHKLGLRLKKLYNVKKTALDAIELSVEDKDPKMSASLANAARNKIDQLSQTTVKQSQAQLLKTLKGKIDSDAESLNALSDSLTSIRTQYNVYDLEGQVQVLIEQLSLAKSKGQTSNAQRLQKQIDNFNAGYSIVSSLSAEHKEFSEQLSIDKEKYKQLEASYTTPYAAIHVIEEASAPLVKSSPKRSLYVIGAALFSFLFSIVGALIFDAYKKIEWKEVLHD